MLDFFDQVVLASMMDLSCGFSRDLFLEWAENPKNTIIFTARSSPGTLARTLIEHLETKQVDLEVLKFDSFDYYDCRSCNSHDSLTLWFIGQKRFTLQNFSEGLWQWALHYDWAIVQTNNGIKNSPIALIPVACKLDANDPLCIVLTQ